MEECRFLDNKSIFVKTINNTNGSRGPDATKKISFSLQIGILITYLLNIANLRRSNT